MDTKLLRKPWLTHALCSLLSLHRQPKVALPLVQVLNVETASNTAIVSDRYHYICAIFTDDCIEKFAQRTVRLGAITTKPCICSLGKVNGGFLKLRQFHFKFTKDGQRVTLLVQAFDFIGAEETYTCGDPSDVHNAVDVRKFKAVLPKGWSYTMERKLGFNMCEYDECEIPGDQQDVLDTIGWAFPTTAGANARPACRATLANVHAKTAGTDKTEPRPVPDLVLQADCTINPAANAHQHGTDGSVMSPQPNDESVEEDEQGQPFVFINSDGESSYSEDEGSAATPTSLAGGFDAVAPASTYSDRGAPATARSGRVVKNPSGGLAAAATADDDCGGGDSGGERDHAARSVQNEPEGPAAATDTHAVHLDQGRRTRKRPRICYFRQPASKRTGRDSQQARLTPIDTVSDAEHQPKKASTSEVRSSMSVTNTTAAKVPTFSTFGGTSVDASAVASAAIDASGNCLEVGPNRVNTFGPDAGAGRRTVAKAGVGAKAAAKAMAGRYYQSLLAGQSKRQQHQRKKRLVAKREQQQQQAQQKQAHNCQQSAGLGWRC